MTVRIIDRDRGFARLMRAIRARMPAVTTGIPDDSPAAEPAILAEFGTRHEPARPLLRGWFDSVGRALGRRLERDAAVKVLRGEDPTAAAVAMGEQLATSMRDHVRAGVGPPLDPDTDNPDRPPFAGTSIPDAITSQIHHRR